MSLSRLGGRWLGLGLALALTALAASPAQAQVVLHDEPPASFRSPQSWALELRAGPYYPAIDSEFTSGTRPHEQYFGKKKRVMFQLEVDYQFFDLFGTLAVGASVGYLRENANAFIAPAAGQMPTQRSNDRTSLILAPAALLLVYRLDVAAQNWGVPLVPYAKAGLNYTAWWITDGNGDTARDPSGTGKARGATPGWQVAVGLALMLDWLEPSSARELDGNTGVNHTYLFAEYLHVESSGLGRKNVLDVGDTTWAAGLLFEF